MRLIARLCLPLVGLAMLLSACSKPPVSPTRAEALAQEAALADAIAQEPDNGALRVDLAKVQLKLGNGLGAEASLRRAVDLGMAADMLRPLAARAVMLQGENGRALALLEGGPVPPEAIGQAGHVAGVLNLALGNIDAARAGFDIAIREQPRDSALWVDVARFRDANADAAGARDAVDFAIELDPNNAAALALKANLVRFQEGLSAALPWYEKALAIDPDNVPALLDHAATLGDLGHYRAMLTQVRHAARLDPKSPRPYFIQAVLAARAGDYRLARSLLQRTGNKLDDEPAFLLLSAAVELELDGAAVAADLADQLTALQPHNLTARRILAAASWASGDYDGAAEALGPIIARADADSWSLHLAARLAAEREDSEEAERLLRRAASLTRGDAAPLAEVDNFGILAGKADDAPLNPLVVIPAIRVELARGDTARAMNRAAILLDANRGVADAQLLFGDTAMAAKQWRAAIRAFRDARALDAGSRTALRLANAQHLAGDPAGAAATILALQQSQGALVVADRLSGHLAMDLRKWDEALDWFESVRRRLGNRDVVILREMARAYAAKGDHVTADVLAMHSVRLQPLSRDLILLWAQQREALQDSAGAADLRARASAL